MKNRTIMRTANSEQRTANSEQRTANSEQPIIARLKAWAKSKSFIYYPVHWVRFSLFRTRVSLFRTRAFMKWQIHKALTRFNCNGLNTTEHRDRKIIASLTSYPARINIVPYVIASILNQTMKPDKIVLWLGIEKFPDKKLPKIFDKVKACGVDIEFREDIGPLTKYFYAMKEYPEDIVITFDDDLVYDSNVIEVLYASYLEHPKCVSAMRVHKMKFLADGNVANYNTWEWEYKYAKGHESHVYFATGVAGVLYPPNSIHSEALNLEVIRQYSLVTDDIWWKIMSVMKNTKVVPASDESRICAWTIPNSQTTAMYHINVERGNNDREIKIMLELYNTWPSNGKTLLEMMREDSDGVE